MGQLMCLKLPDKIGLRCIAVYQYLYHLHTAYAVLQTSNGKLVHRSI